MYFHFFLYSWRVINLVGLTTCGPVDSFVSRFKQIDHIGWSKSVIQTRKFINLSLSLSLQISFRLSRPLPRKPSFVLCLMEKGKTAPNEITSSLRNLHLAPSHRSVAITSFPDSFCKIIFLSFICLFLVVLDYFVSSYGGFVGPDMFEW